MWVTSVSLSPRSKRVGLAAQRYPEKLLRFLLRHRELEVFENLPRCLIDDVKLQEARSVQRLAETQILDFFGRMQGEIVRMAADRIEKRGIRNEQRRNWIITRGNA